MIKILFIAFIYTCIFNFAALKRRGAKEVFDMTADDMIDAAIGIQEFKKRHQNINRNLFKNKSDVLLRSLRENEIQLNATATTAKPVRKNIKVKLLPKLRDPPVNTEEIKTRIRNIEVLYLLNNKRSVIPDFRNDSDNPDHITLRFDASNARRYRPNYEVDGNADIHSYDRNNVLMSNRGDKNRVFDLMRQFLYMTRYKISVMAGIRKKYKHHLKYQIGYCFALLRLVRSQQKTLYSTLMLYNNTMTNALTHLQIYHKIVRQNIDIKDIVLFVRNLNHAQKLKQDPTYYDDSEEGFQPPRIKFTGDK